uniref:Uncharacterized protein n=1 Tax=Anguilla anguilla TaxID=7936 RepID=A0A0E9Q4M1_ANGAN
MTRTSHSDHLSLSFASRLVVSNQKPSTSVTRCKHFLS